MHKLNKYLDLKDKSEIKNDEKDNEVNSIIDQFKRIPQDRFKF